MRRFIIILAACSWAATAGAAPHEAPIAPDETSPSGNVVAPSTHPEPATSSSGMRFAHATTEGLIGGVHAVDAASGTPGTFRVSLYGRYFGKDGFVARGDGHRHTGASLALNVTPIEHLELAAELTTYATQNRTTAPEVVQVIGDVHLFGKGFAHVLPWLAVGGDAELALLNGMGRIGVVGAATSVGLRGAATADFRALPRHLPIIVRANLRYLFDNSGRLIRDTENARYASLATPTERIDEHRHLLTAGERYALQVNRVDRLGASIGIELPLKPHERVELRPLLEWGFALPVNRQGYDCVVTQAGERDGCLASEGFRARPSQLTLGLRAQPFLAGLGALLAIDIGTSGHRTFVRELAPTARYTLQFGLSYAYDPRVRPAPATRAPRVEIPAASPRGHVVGRVVESRTGTPVAEAIVHFEATDLSDIVTDHRGTFRSAELAPGAQGMRIRARGHREALCVAVVPTSGADVHARCELAESAQLGQLRGRVMDYEGKPLSGARLSLVGAEELAVTSGPDGAFIGERLPAGRHTLRVEADGYFPASASVQVEAGQTDEAPTLRLYPRPKQPQVRIGGKRILMGRPVPFVGNGATLAPASFPLLTELADALATHPEIAHVEVQGHLDARSDPAREQALSEERARAVRDWLIAAGIAPARLSAVGYGGTEPLVPNITPINRARNRRIELLVK